MADHDLLAALITVWASDIASTNPKINSEAKGMLALARRVGGESIPLINGACRVTGLEPSKLLDQVEARAKSLAHGQNIASSRPRPLTASRPAKKGAINRG